MESLEGVGVPPVPFTAIGFIGIRKTVETSGTNSLEQAQEHNWHPVITYYEQGEHNPKQLEGIRSVVAVRGPETFYISRATTFRVGSDAYDAYAAARAAGRPAVLDGKVLLSSAEMTMMQPGILQGIESEEVRTDVAALFAGTIASAESREAREKGKI